MENFPATLKGYFLMAMPALSDPNFHQSVTCISEHTDQGAMGIVINQIHEGLNGRMIFEELEIRQQDHTEMIPIHIGGPVHVNELFVLHGPPLDWGDSFVICEELALSNSREILDAIAQNQGPESYLISLGCAGWAPGQLEWELSQNAWIVCPSQNKIIFEVPVADRWTSALGIMGIDPQLLSDTAGRA